MWTPRKTCRFLVGKLVLQRP